MTSENNWYVLRGKCVVQEPIAGTDAYAVQELLDKLIDRAPLMRRLGSTNVRTGPGFRELTVEFEYGPTDDAGADLKAVLGKAISQEFKSFEVWSVSRRPLNKMEVEALAARMEDLNVPLTERKRIADALPGLRQRLSEPQA